MKTKTLLSTILVCALLTGCSTNEVSTTSTVQDSYSNTSLTEVFDTVYSFKEYTQDTDLAKAHFKASESELQKYTQLFDIYNDYEGINNLKTINDNAGKKEVKVDQSIIDMLKLAKEFYELSDGEFDITIGSLLKVWHEYREEGISLNEEGKKGKVPSKEELEEAAQYKGWQHIHIDEENNIVYIDDKNVSLDVGGIAKGYATECTAQTMISSSMEVGILNVGRNIRLIGTKDTPWNVGISDPLGEYPNGLVILSLDSAESVVTSGDYERYYEAEDGNRYPHIVDPSTMYPARYYRSVTIVTEDSGIADCLSTALFTMTIEEGKQLLENYTKQSGKQANAVWVMDPNNTQEDLNNSKVGDYVVTYTDGLKENIAWN